MRLQETAAAPEEGLPPNPGAAAGAFIRFEIIRDARHFESLEQNWRSLWLATGGGVFQSYEWVRSWLTRRNAQCQLHMAAAWRGAQLAAILPLVVRRVSGVRMLEWAGQSASDYCDCLGGGPEILRRLWTAAWEAQGFDVVRLKSVRADAAMFPVLSHVVGPPAAPSDVCLQVRRLWPDGQAWFKTLNKKKRNNYTRSRRLLMEMGVEPQLYKFACQPADSMVARLMELKRHWMKAQRLSKGDLDLLPDMIDTLGKLGCLRVFALQCKGQPAAGLVGAVQSDRMLAFFAAYDPSFARASPGTTLLTDATIWAFDQGLDVVDYLRGDETYKFEFANHAVDLFAFTQARSLLGKGALWGHSAFRRQFAAPAPECPPIGTAYFTQNGRPRSVGQTQPGGDR